MEQSYIYNPPLLVYKNQNVLSHPQKCKIPHKNINLPASSLVKVKNQNRTFICRLFFLSEIYDDKLTAFVDDSVELNSTIDCGEINYVDEIEAINDPVENFSKISIKIIIHPAEIEFKLIKSSSDISKIVKSILKHFTFSSGCTISCFRRGISKIQILSTNESGFGSINDDSEVIIEEIFVNTSQRQNVKLGGLKDVKKEFSDFISKNIEFLKNPSLLKPSSNCLIIGPVGCGKTSLIHSIAEGNHCNVFEVSSDVFLPYPGEFFQIFN